MVDIPGDAAWLLLCEVMKDYTVHPVNRSVEARHIVDSLVSEFCGLPTPSSADSTGRSELASEYQLKVSAVDHADSFAHRYPDLKDQIFARLAKHLEDSSETISTFLLDLTSMTVGC